MVEKTGEPWEKHKENMQSQLKRDRGKNRCQMCKESAPGVQGKHANY